MLLDHPYSSKIYVIQIGKYNLSFDKVELLTCYPPCVFLTLQSATTKYQQINECYIKKTFHDLVDNHTNLDIYKNICDYGVKFIPTSTNIYKIKENILNDIILAWINFYIILNLMLALIILKNITKNKLRYFVGTWKNSISNISKNHRKPLSKINKNDNEIWNITDKQIDIVRINWSNYIEISKQ